MTASNGDAAPPCRAATIQFEPTLFAKAANLEPLLRPTEEAAAWGANWYGAMQAPVDTAARVARACGARPGAWLAPAQEAVGTR